MQTLKQTVGQLHGKHVFGRRIEALAHAIAPLLHPGPVLDLGAGNGMIGALLMSMRPDTEVVGIDVHLRPDSAIPVTYYDGTTIPFEDQHFSSVIVVDVLHHTDDYRQVLRECARVCRNVIVVKDHFYANPLDHLLLRGLDWVGNAPHGVRLPYNYFTRQSWTDSLSALSLHEKVRQESVANMYPYPFQWIIGQRIQFISQLEPKH